MDRRFDEIIGELAEMRKEQRYIMESFRVFISLTGLNREAVKRVDSVLKPNAEQNQASNNKKKKSLKRSFLKGKVVDLQNISDDDEYSDDGNVIANEIKKDFIPFTRTQFKC